MDLSNRMASFQEAWIRKETLRSQHARYRQGLVDEIVRLTSDIQVLQQSSVVLRGLLQDLVGDDLKTIDKLVTDGLRRVFHDQADLVFVSELVERNNQLQISFKTEQGVAKGDATDSFGASVTVVESLLLRIIVLLKLGLAPVLLLDESLAQVSDHYLEPLGKLLKSLCKDLGLTVLLVTHQQEFQETADVVYQADCDETGPVRTLILKKIKDTHGHPGSC